MAKQVIDKRFFEQGDNLIPGVAEGTVNNEIVELINQYADSFLEKALGYTLFKEFKEALTANPTDGPYYEILMGGEYSDCRGILRKWKGLRQDAIYKSIVADYCYYFYMKKKVTRSSTSGENVPKKENAKDSTIAYKLKDQWNYMVDEVHILWDFLYRKTDDAGVKVYPSFNRCAADVKEFTHQNTFGI